MPTTDIIGYLWTHRQDLDIDGLPDLLQLISDMQRLGLDAVRVEEYKIFGVPTGATVQLVRHTDEEWAVLVEEILMKGAVEHTIDMLHRHEESEGA